jgi:phospholipase D1/2
LCDGRYDTPEHRLFKDLDTIFKDDFHNPTFPVSSVPSIFFLSIYFADSLTEFSMLVLIKLASWQVNKNGPRQPWHDLHCKIEGPAAYDILTNFEQRWRKSAKWKVSVRRAVSWHHDTLVKIDRMSWIVSPSSDELNAHVCEEKDPENWHVQVQWVIHIEINVTNLFYYYSFY